MRAYAEPKKGADRGSIVLWIPIFWFGIGSPQPKTQNAEPRTRTGRPPARYSPVKRPNWPRRLRLSGTLVPLRRITT